MVMHKMKVILLCFVILVASICRFYLLGDIPIGLGNDEANTGYDAYSVLKTGKDQWGQFLPLTFKGFGDYRTPLYTYLAVPTVAVFGLNEFAVRFPSAIFGVMTIVITYFLINQLFKNQLMSLAGSFILAINPWHIGMSRVAMEANVALFFIVLGLCLFLKSLERSYLFPLSFISFVFSFYCYTSTRLFVPLLLLVLFFLHLRWYKFQNKFLLSGIVISLVLILPILLTGKETAKVRFGQVNFTRDVTLVNTINEKIGECYKDWPSFACRIAFNKVTVYSQKLLSNYLHHFSFDFLFTLGAPSQWAILPKRGLLYFFELPLLSAGIFLLISRKDKNTALLIGWMLLSPLADTFTSDGHYVRSFIFLPSFQIIEAYAAVTIWQFFTRKKFILLPIIMLAFFEFFAFIPEYISYFPKFYSAYSHYGYRQLYQYLKGVEDKYNEIHVSYDAYNTKQYILYLFYSRFDPLTYQTTNEIVRSEGADGWVDVTRVGKYYFFPSFKLSRISGDQALAVISISDYPYTKIHDNPYMKAPLFAVFDPRPRGDPLFVVADSRQIRMYENWRKSTE